MCALWIGPVTTASIAPFSASVAASSIAATAARAVSGFGGPNEQVGSLPMIWYSAALESLPDLSAASTISGPMPAQSPSVMPIRLPMAQCGQGRQPWQLGQLVLHPV